MNRIFLSLLPFLLAADWPAWRGPTADGVSTDTGFPIEWDGKSSAGVKWKVKLPGTGNSSPVVMGNDVLITATSGRAHGELHILCYDRKTGKLRWQTDLTGTPADAPFSMFPPERGHAACTPVVTADAIYALFGTGDLIALDRKGQPLWMRSLIKEYGVIRNDYGLAASPVLVDGVLLVQVDHLEGSYLLAADAVTGKSKWRAERKGVYDNWSTPAVATMKGVKCVVCTGTKTLKCYDLTTGKVVATVDGLERLCSPTPIVRGEIVYVVSGPSGASFAFDLSAGEKPKILWQTKKSGPFVPSGVVANDLYFVPDDQGTVTCYDLVTGAEKWKERVANSRMRPSPVAAEGRVYFTALDGTTHVLKAAAEYEPLAKNPLGEDVAASFALSDGEIFIRGQSFLFSLGRRSEVSRPIKLP